MAVRRTGRSWWLAGSGLAALLLGVALGISAVRAWGERAAYLRARPCTAGPADTCFEEIQARVSGAQLVR